MANGENINGGTLASLAKNGPWGAIIALIAVVAFALYLSSNNNQNVIEAINVHDQHATASVDMSVKAMNDLTKAIQDLRLDLKGKTVSELYGTN